jgi:hypothetical protein
MVILCADLPGLEVWVVGGHREPRAGGIVQRRVPPCVDVQVGRVSNSRGRRCLIQDLCLQGPPNPLTTSTGFPAGDFGIELQNNYVYMLVQ